MHGLFGRQEAKNLICKEGHTIKEDLCFGIGSHRCMWSYRGTNIQWSSVFCGPSWMITPEVVGIHDQEQRLGVRLFSKLPCGSRARDMVVIQISSFPQWGRIHRSIWEGAEYAFTCKVAKNLLGWGSAYNNRQHQSFSSICIGDECSKACVHRKGCQLQACEGFQMSSISSHTERQKVQAW